jgi:hypothetical protein
LQAATMTRPFTVMAATRGTSGGPPITSTGSPGRCTHNHNGPVRGVTEAAAAGVATGTSKGRRGDKVSGLFFSGFMGSVFLRKINLTP